MIFRGFHEGFRRPANFSFGGSVRHHCAAGDAGDRCFDRATGARQPARAALRIINADEAIAQWRKGEAEGVVDTKLTVRNMIEQLDNQLKLTPEESPYWGPIKAFPKDISAADRTRLTEAYRTSISTVIYPALRRL